MNDQEYAAYHDQRYDELSSPVLELADLIFEAYALEGKASLFQTYLDADGSPFWFTDAFGHHGGGTSVRNLLRANKLTDDLVPTGNLDDYYVVLIERWLGVRK